jgi:hypothetical protein
MDRDELLRKTIIIKQRPGKRRASAQQSTANHFEAHRDAAL